MSTSKLKISDLPMPQARPSEDDMLKDCIKQFMNKKPWSDYSSEYESNGNHVYWRGNRVIVRKGLLGDEQPPEILIYIWRNAIYEAPFRLSIDSLLRALGFDMVVSANEAKEAITIKNKTTGELFTPRVDNWIGIHHILSATNQPAFDLSVAQNNAATK